MTIHILLLVRHGEASASWGEHNDPGLSKEGQNQAHALIAVSYTHLTLPTTPYV